MSRRANSENYDWIPKEIQLFFKECELAGEVQLWLKVWKLYGHRTSYDWESRCACVFQGTPPNRGICPRVRIWVDSSKGMLVTSWTEQQTFTTLEEAMDYADGLIRSWGG